jgi:hypothetical protein
MSVTLNNIAFYGSANMPTADGTTTGGAVSFSTRIGFTNLASTGTVNYVSDSASDTATTLAVVGRDSTGTIQTETKTLTGTTPVSGAQSFQQLLSFTAGGTTAVGDIAAISNTAIVTGTAQSAANTSGATGPQIVLQSGQGASCAVDNIIRITNNTPSGVQFQLRRIVAISTDTVTVDRDWATVPSSSTTYTVNSGALLEVSPNQVTKIIRAFYNCQAQASGGSNLTFYAKIFPVNNNTSTSAQAQSGHTGVNFSIQLTTPSLPSGATLQMGLTSTLNDTATVVNRQTAPGGVSFTTGALPVNQDMSANSGVLPAGAAPNTAGAQGLWLALTLNAGAAPFDGIASLQALFATT